MSARTRARQIAGMLDKQQRDAESRVNAMMTNSEDPVEREAAALIARMGRSWYHTESQARQVVLAAAKEVLAAREAADVSDVQRYSIGVSLDGQLKVDPDSTGEWVRFADLEPRLNNGAR